VNIAVCRHLGVSSISLLQSIIAQVPWWGNDMWYYAIELIRGGCDLDQIVLLPIASVTHAFEQAHSELSRRGESLPSYPFEPLVIRSLSSEQLSVIDKSMARAITVRWIIENTPSSMIAPTLARDLKDALKYAQTERTKLLNAIAAAAVVETTISTDGSPLILISSPLTIPPLLTLILSYI
jgi:hypothetical protein